MAAGYKRKTTKYTRHGCEEKFVDPNTIGMVKLLKDVAKTKW